MNSIRKIVMVLAIVFTTLSVNNGNAFAWGLAVHAHIADALTQDSDPMNSAEIYGSVTPDIFNYVFDSNYAGDLAADTHYDYAKTWSVARSAQERATAYGLASHNESWGADSTAHVSGLTSGQGEGYVTEKAWLLQPVMLAQLQQLFPDYPPQLLEGLAFNVSHIIVENGLDLLVKRSDPAVGEKMLRAALGRSEKVPDLLVEAYAWDLAQMSGMRHSDAARFIVDAEQSFREYLILYGSILMQEEASALWLGSQATADFAEGYLGAYGIVLPEGVDLTPIIAYATEQAMLLCAQDFSVEMDATVSHVDQMLRANGIDY